jgi:hypothetical protein
MAKKPGTRAEFVLFDVFYEDGSQRSNRKVPSTVLGGLDGDEPARAIIEEQDRAIAEKSGLPAIPIKSVRRSGGKWAPDGAAEPDQLLEELDDLLHELIKHRT